MSDAKKCYNGCDAPICAPSKVICRACLDKITRALEHAAGVTRDKAEAKR